MDEGVDIATLTLLGGLAAVENTRYPVNEKNIIPSNVSNEPKNVKKLHKLIEDAKVQFYQDQIILHGCLSSWS